MFFYVCEEFISTSSIGKYSEKYTSDFLNCSKTFQVGLKVVPLFIVKLMRTKLININNETETKVQSVYHRVSKRVFLVLLK